MTPSEHIDKSIEQLSGWQKEMYSELRKIINETSPELKEDWKWGTAVWSGKKLVLALSAFKNHIKLNFFKGAFLNDPDKFINNGFDSKEHRSVDFHEGDNVDTHKIRQLIYEALLYDKAS